MPVSHQHQLRKYRTSLSGNVYTITKCQQKSDNSYLTSYKGLAHKIIDTFLFCQDQTWIKLAAFVIMPDHYHLICQLGKEKSLAQIMHSINTLSAKFAGKHWDVKKPFWQAGYYDHLIRHEKELLIPMNYIEENPIRAGLVEEARDWPYSSACGRWRNSVDRSWVL